MEPQLARSRSAVPRLLWRDSAGSTNSELIALAADGALPSFTTLVTDDQTAGRGRLDRAWVAPAGTALAISVLVRPELPFRDSMAPAAMGWLPLAAGVAMAGAAAEVLPAGAAVGVKWPNDVQIGGLKVCGILSELVPAQLSSGALSSGAPSSGPAVVIGAGVNVTMTAGQLPVPTATSLVIAGADPAQLEDRVLDAYLRGLTALVTGLWQHGGDAERSGLRAEAVARCTTIGRAVRVELPGGAELHGTAVGIDPLGRLEVRDGSGRVQPIAAGDVIHLR